MEMPLMVGKPAMSMAALQASKQLEALSHAQEWMNVAIAIRDQAAVQSQSSTPAPDYLYPGLRQTFAPQQRALLPQEAALPPGAMLRLSASGLDPMMSLAAGAAPAFSAPPAFGAPLPGAPLPGAPGLFLDHLGGAAAAHSQVAAPPFLQAPHPAAVHAIHGIGADKQQTMAGPPGLSPPGAPQNTLRAYLEEVRHLDPERVFVVRRINKLGFSSPVTLRQHFRKYGSVTKAMVAHKVAQVKLHPGNTDRQPRTRPGNIGLVVMGSAEAVRKVLAESNSQVVKGVKVSVHKFDKSVQYQDEEHSEVGKQAGGAPTSRTPDGGIGSPGAVLAATAADPADVVASKSQTSEAEADAAAFVASVVAKTQAEEAAVQHQAAPAEAARVQEANASISAAALRELSLINQKSSRMLASGQDSTEVAKMARMVQEAMQALQCLESKLQGLETGPVQDTRSDTVYPYMQAIQEAGSSKMHSENLQAPISSQGTLRAHLTLLQKENPECIFIARRINKLGFRSREVLHSHYSQLAKSWHLPSGKGEVCRVLVAHSKVKPFHDTDGRVRTRPGGLGFVIMSSVEVVRLILAQGQRQVIEGHEVRVQRFDRPALEDNESNDWNTMTRSTTGESQEGQEQFSGQEGATFEEISESSLEAEAEAEAEAAEAAARP
mmetsp:Transcript_8000/g.17368  ORF Transcript_8000/g.17368 Transcript_8000/m.17368 type:complete len:662 (-) Transcript_8000:72-2057(-)